MMTRKRFKKKLHKEVEKFINSDRELIYNKSILEELRDYNPYKKKMKDNWRKLIDHINSYNIGDIVKRKDLTSLSFVYPNEPRMSSLAQSTLDSYRRCLTLCRYLDDRDQEGNKFKRGTYVLLRHVPITLTLNECKRKAYEKRYN